MPSVADLIFIVVFFLLTCTSLSIKLLGDAGIGWHIRTGQQILASHAIPRTDVFSSVMSGKPWFAWEWLYDVVVGRLESSLGLNGVVWFTAAIIAATFAATFALLRSKGTNLFVALALVLLATSASTIHFLARPHVLTWLFAVLWLWILDSTSGPSFRRSSLRLWLLPILMVLWANLHGGFLLGFALIGIYWAAALRTWLSTREAGINETFEKIAARKRTWSLSLVAIASVVASCINPYGWKLHAHIYSYLTNRFLMDHIDEFRSPNFHGVAEKCFLALLLIAIAAAIARGKSIGMVPALLLLFATWIGLEASRNIPIAAILLAVAVGPALLRGFKPEFSLRMEHVDAQLQGHVWPIVAIAVLFVVAANGGRAGTLELMNAHFDSNRMPVGAAEFVKNQAASGAILAPDYWGGYLIYRLFPPMQVVVDDRHDLYGEPFLRSYLAAMHGEEDWKRFLLEHPSAYIVLPRQAALAAILAQSGEWKELYRDNTAVVFGKGR